MLAFTISGLASAPVASAASAAPAAAATQPAATQPAAATAPAAGSPTVSAAAAGPAFVCTAPAEFARFTYPLRHTARRLAAGEPLTIVAIGSSSTSGAGASSRAASYPSRLAIELKERFPAEDITVLNRGVNGEETAQMMARFDTGVIAEHPDLVLWQVGTNSVLRDAPLQEHSVLLHEGIARLKAAGADVVLMDLQYHPEGAGQGRNPGNAGSDSADGQGNLRRSVQPFRGDARLARSSAHSLRGVSLAGFAAHERLELRLRCQAARARDRRRGEPPACVGGDALTPFQFRADTFSAAGFRTTGFRDSRFQRSFGITSLANISMLRSASTSDMTPNCSSVTRMSKPV